MTNSRLEFKFDVDIVISLPCYDTERISAQVIDNEWVLDADIKGVPNFPFNISKILYFADISKDKESQRDFDKAFCIAKPKQHVCKMVYFENNQKNTYYIVGDAASLQTKVNDIEDTLKYMHIYDKFEKLQNEIKEEYDKRRID